MAEKIEYPEKIDKMGALINTERQAKGLNPLYMVPYLIDCAAIRADEVSVVWGHNRPNGEYFVTVIDYDIAAYENIFENLTGGSETAEEAMEQFRNSPKHWQAILNEGITHMGIGLVYNPDGYAGAKWYWCQILLDDLRGSDYKYEGQYLPGVAGLTNGKVKISVLNADTGAYFPNLSVIVRHNTTGAKHDLSGVKVTQNGTGITFGTSDDKSVIYFTTGNSPTEITDMPSGDYLLEIQSPTGYYSNNFVSLSGYYYTDFTMKNDGSEIPDITANLTARKLSVLKTDADTGDALSGAVLELSGNTRLDEVEVSQSCKLSDDRKTITFTSGNSPVVFTKIPSGNYTLYEYSAPEGYIKAEKAVFTVGDNTITLADGNKSGIVENNVLIMPDKKRIINLFPISYENSIKVFDLSEPQEGFNSNGLAVLRPSSCTSHKSADTWDVELVHPIDEWGKWKYLLPENVLKINGQLFRIDIMETDCSEDGTFVTVHARHISYDLVDRLIEEEVFEGGNAQDFIDFCNAKSFMDYGNEETDLFYKEYEFAVTSDIETVLKGDKYTNVTYMGALIGVDNCLVNRYGGEIYRDNFRISINKRMENARDDAFFLRYGVNVSGIKQRIDYTDFATTVDCTDNYGNKVAISYTGDSRWAFHHRRRQYFKFNYSDATTAMNQLDNDTGLLWADVSSPKTTYTVKVNQLKADPRFEDFKKILDCDYGDCGTIYFPELDINTTQKIVSIDRDEILNEITDIELGNITPSIVRPNFMGNTVSSGHSIFDKMR